MSYPDAILSGFCIKRPEYESTQEDTLSWLIEAHLQAETNSTPGFVERFPRLVKHIACKTPLINKRGHSLRDFLHQNWHEMEVYTVKDHPSGKDLGIRNGVFGRVSLNILLDFYQHEDNAPDDLLHVTCTGYNAPSAIQKLASIKKWEEKTRLTHIYHMGCYAAIPAIRVASGQIASSSNKQHRSDIVHTELCSLHFNPAMHDPDQIVAQSLFADGFIKYRVEHVSQKTDLPYLKVLTTHEEIVPNSEEAMTWHLSGFGFAISLAKEIPSLIAERLSSFLARMCTKTNLSWDKLQKEALFAIHPGGPKILKNIGDMLELSEFQLQHSYEILKNYGNMSSATLPHIWERILHENTHSNKYVVSLAFGPGLTISGIILQVGEASR